MSIHIKDRLDKIALDLAKNLEQKLNYYIHLCTKLITHITLNDILTHTKQVAFHAPITTGVYSVGFDVFRYLSRRPVF